MFESTKPYNIEFVQKASPRVGDAFDFSYIYKFYTERTKECQRLKYIIRVEVIKDIFILKFYAARDRKLDEKYNRILKVHGYRQSLNIFYSCSSVVPLIMAEYPDASFAINGAQSRDFISDKIEHKSNNQRFRIYKYIANVLFGKESFEHYEFKDISSYLMVNKKACTDVEVKKDEIKDILVKKYEIEI